MTTIMLKVDEQTGEVTGTNQQVADAVRTPRPVFEPTGGEITPEGIPPITDQLADADLVELIPTYLRDVQRSIHIEQGRLYTPTDVEQALFELSDRLDRGQTYIAALQRAYSEARAILDVAEATAIEDVVAESQAAGERRPPAEDIRKARVVLRTTRQREQCRRVRLLLDLSEARMKHLRHQTFIAQSIGANVRASMSAQPGWSS